MLTQTAHVDHLLDYFGMSDSKPAPNPCTPTPLISGDDDMDAKFPFRYAVGSMMYIGTCTRPHIAFAVGAVVRHVNAPTPA